MNFKSFYSLQQESAIVMREFHNFPKIMELKWKRFKSKLVKVLTVRDKLEKLDLLDDLDYYLRPTLEEELVKKIHKVLEIGQQYSTYDYISKEIEGFRRIYDAALKEKSGWLMSDLLRHFYNGLSRIIRNLKEDIFWVLYDEKMKERLSDSYEAWEKIYHDADYGWGELEKEYVYLLIRIKNHVEEYIQELYEIEKRLGNHIRVYSNRLGDSSVLEPLETIEIAYHASVNARNIFQNGFKPEYKSENSNEGIGGSNITNGISFTFDLYHAKNIAKVLKTTWLIANKKYNFRDIVEMIKHFPRDNVKIDDVIKNYKRYAEDSEFPIRNEYQLFNFYQISLWNTETYNPVFFGIDRKKFIDFLKTKDYKDIGIVQCQIRTDGEYSYHRAMEEIRVTPQNVVSVDKLIQ